MTLLGRAVLPHSVPTATDSAIYGGPLLSDPYVLDRVFPALVTASKVIVTANPTSVTPNVPFSLTVNAVDASNFLAAGYSGSATVTKASGPGTFSGTLTASFVAGVLTFSNLLLDTTGSYTLTISSGSLTPGTTSSFAVAIIVYFSDNFNHGSFGVADTGQTWQLATGSMTITSNQAVGGGASHNLAYIDAGHANGKLTGTLVSTGYVAMIGRLTDFNHNIQAGIWNGSKLRVFNNTVLGGQQDIAGTVEGSTTNDVVDMVFNGPRTIIKRNGFVVQALLDTLNQTSTKHGFYTFGTTTPVDTVSFTSDTSDAPWSGAALPMVVFDGNSLTAGNGASTSGGGWTSQLMRTSSRYKTAHYVNWGIGGQDTPTITADRSNNIDPYHSFGNPFEVLLVWEVSNDIANNGASATTAYNNLVAYVNAAKAAGWREVWVLTVIDRSSFFGAGGMNTTTFRASAATVNSSITGAGSPPWDRVIDVASDTRLQNSANTTYFADGTHCTDAGYAIVASMVDAALTSRGIIAGGVSWPTATRLAFLATPGAGTGGVAFSPQPVVEAQNSAGLRDTSYNGSLTLSIASGGSSITGTTTITMVNGLGVFSGLSIPLGGTYTLGAASGTLTGATSSAFTLATAITIYNESLFIGSGGTNLSAYTPDVGAAWTIVSGTAQLDGSSDLSVATTTLLAVVDSSHADCHVKGRLVSAGTGNAIALIFRYVDSSNFFYYQELNIGWALRKIVAGVDSAIINGSTGTANNDDIDINLSGSTITVSRNGSVVTTQTDSFNSTATKHGIRGGAVGGVITNFYVTGASAGTATHLSFSQQPVATGKGIAFTTMPKVQALLAGGGVDTSYTANVTLGITSGSGGTAGAGATLSGTVTVAAVAGVADFTSAGLSLNQGGTAYQLHATSGALTAADSSAFDVASVYADFNGADSSTLLINPGTGQTWTVQVGGPFKNISNQAKLDTGAEGQVTVSAGSANGYTQVTIVNATGADGGFVFRYQDSGDFWLVRNLGGNTDFYLRSGGGYTLIGQSAGAANGDVLKAVYNGSSITIYRNGTSILSTTDATFSTQQLVGLRANSATVIWDTFETVPA